VDRLNEKLFVVAFHNSPIGMAIAALNGQWLKVNASLCALTGYPEQQLLQKSFQQQMTVPEDLEKESELAEMMLAGEIDHYSIEKRYYHKLGHIVWVHCHTATVRDDHGQSDYFIAQIQDITGRKAEEEDPSEQYFQRLVELSPEPMAIHCEDKLVCINKAGAELLGASQQQLIGVSRFELVHPDYLNESTKNVDRILADGKPSKVREIKLLTRDGRSIEVGIRSAPITYMGRKALQVVYMDISEQKRLEKVLKESNELATNILESIPDAFFAVDAHWNITYANHVTEKYLNKSAQQLVGNNLWKQFPALVETAFYHSYHKALAEKVVVEFEEFSPVTKEWYEVRACPSKDGLAIYYRNVTKRKTMEEQVLYYAKELEVSQAQLKQIVDNIDAGVWSADLTTKQFILSPGIETIYGYPMQAFLENPNFWKEKAHPDDLHLVEMQEQAILSGKSSIHEHRIVHASGEVRVIRNRVTPIFDEANTLVKIVGVFVDITEYQRMQQNLCESREWLSTTLKCIGDGVIATDTHGKITFMNPIAEALTAWKEGDALGKHIENILNLINEDTRLQVLNPVVQVMRERGIVALANHTLLINKNGTEIPIDDSAAPILNEHGEMVGIVMVFRDVIERKRHEETIRHYAYYDTLTGLPNRRLFHDRFAACLANAKQEHNVVATMFLDLDHFKLINDSLGHEIGDLLLTEVAHRLTLCVPESSAVIARLGGDEFIIVLQDADRTTAAVVAEKIIKSISSKYLINGHMLFTSPSVGISFYPEDGEDAPALIKAADMAMYVAKTDGKKNYRFYDSFMNDKMLRKLDIEKGLRLAVEKNEFELYYQSKVVLSTGGFLGVEALIRWHHPQLGMVSPAEFIPIAEEIGMIGTIGEWVLETACWQCKEWQQTGYPAMRVAVNVSTLQFRQHDLVGKITSILAATGLEPKYLELEITESVMQNEESIKKLHVLKELGIYISIDDFGTGYSSLSYLKRLSIDALKIDRSFIFDIYNEPANEEIVSTIITLGKSLNLKVIAEGVETVEQLRFLTQYKCDEVQGYLINEPVPAGQFDIMLKGVQNVAHTLQSHSNKPTGN
jgi:diguanylate cyclase (GGDEF)-like protein/PAS domain S-box-containing protein